MQLQQATGALAATWIVGAGIVGLVANVTSIAAAAVVVGAAVVPPLLLLVPRLGSRLMALRLPGSR